MHHRGAADRRAKAKSETAHAALVDGIWEAADAGWQQVEIVKATGLTGSGSVSCATRSTASVRWSEERRTDRAAGEWRACWTCASV